jgi:hypothetical protein
MRQAGLVLGIVAGAIALFVGIQIIASGNAFMPIYASRLFFTLRNVQVAGLPAYAMGAAWVSCGLAIFAHLSSNRVSDYGARLRTLRDILLVVLGVCFLSAAIIQVTRVYGH